MINSPSESGFFTDDGLEYVVTTPHTPHRDWFNYFWNGTYLACASQNMNGSSLYQNENGVVTNLFGKQDMRDDPRWIYIRDNDSGEYWSAGYFPCLSESEEFECRHGLGYSILRILKNGIRVEFRVFVPRSDSCEIWTVTVTNTSRTVRNLSLFVASNIMLDGVHMPYGYLGGISGKYEISDNLLFFKNTTHTVVNEKYRAFMTSDVIPDGWETSREAFLGRDRTFAKPQAVATGHSTNSVASVEYLIGALQHDLQLSPDGDSTIHYLLGVVMDIAEARRLKRKLLTARKIESEFLATKQYNLQRLGQLDIQTPDVHFNNLHNIWLRHQLYLMADWARFYFKGYRDTCQDSAGMSLINPAKAWEMLKKALRNQRSDGFCPRAFRVPSMDVAAADKHYADSPSWISHALDAILRETGDLSLLNEVVEYSDKGKATVWEHAVQAIKFLCADRGQHGLSLIHYGDWNDLIDKAGIRGKGEGVWMSMALARALKITSQIAQEKGDRKVQKFCDQNYEEVSRAIKEYGWDGQHFIYAICDDGKIIGSRNCKEGRVFINPQSWAILAGLIDASAYAKIMRSVEPSVDTPVGPVHNWPPFTKYDHSIGQLSGTPAGYFTNGNVYCHAASFKIAADYAAGRYDKAFETFKRILPSADKSEPYAQANGYVGPTAQRHLHHVSDDPWRTGTVAWSFLNTVDQLLGFERTYRGFHLRPKLPSDWDHAQYTRPFRGVLYRIHITRGDTNSIMRNGEPIEGDFIPAERSTTSSKTINLHVVLKTNNAPVSPRTAPARKRAKLCLA